MLVEVAGHVVIDFADVDGVRDVQGITVNALQHSEVDDDKLIVAVDHFQHTIESKHNNFNLHLSPIALPSVLVVVPMFIVVCLVWVVLLTLYSPNKNRATEGFVRKIASPS